MSIFLNNNVCLLINLNYFYLQESNIGLEMGTQELIQKGIELLMHPQDLKKINISHDGTSLVVAMTMFYGFPFKLKLNLKEGSRELVSIFYLTRLI